MITIQVEHHGGRHLLAQDKESPPDYEGTTFVADFFNAFLQAVRALGQELVWVLLHLAFVDVHSDQYFLIPYEFDNIRLT